MKRSLIPFICLFLFGSDAFGLAEQPKAGVASRLISSSTGGIRGFVLKESGAPLQYVLVRVKSTGGKSWVCESTHLGEFRIGMLPPGRYSIWFEHPGYLGRAQNELVVKPGKWIQLGEIEEPYCPSTDLPVFKLKDKGVTYALN